MSNRDKTERLFFASTSSYPDFYYFNLSNYFLYKKPEFFINYLEGQKQLFIEMMRDKRSSEHDVFVKTVIDGVDIYCMGSVFADVLNIASGCFHSSPVSVEIDSMFELLYSEVLNPNLYKRDFRSFIDKMRVLNSTSPPPLGAYGGKKSKKHTRPTKQKRKKTHKRKSKLANKLSSRV